MADSLPIAVRVYPDLKPAQPRAQGAADRRHARLRLRDAAPTRRRRSRSAATVSWSLGDASKKGLFYADDLTAEEREVLERYVREHAADTDPRGIPERGIPSNPELRLLPIADFRTLLYRVGLQGPRAARRV